VGALLGRKPINPAPRGATTRAAQADLLVEQREESIMSTELTPEQQQRAAAFAAQERQHLQDLASNPPPPSVTDQGAITYTITMSETPDGFAQLNWWVGDQYQTYCTGSTDWVGVFTNTNQAMMNPNSNFLGGAAGWTGAAGGGPFKTDVALVPDMVAAYVIKNAGGQYVSVAITSPWPSQTA
jgi:hypothetical protein